MSGAELHIFKVFEKIAKKRRDRIWEVLTFAQLSGPFTKCFEGQVQQVLYLCSEDSRPWAGFSFTLELAMW